jgi:acetyl-CoA carboxylase beta subunit
MLEIKKTYVTDSKRRPVAVQVDIKTFERMEQLLEDYALGQFIEENNPEDILSVAEAKAYYESLIQKKK